MYKASKIIVVAAFTAVVSSSAVLAQTVASADVLAACPDGTCVITAQEYAALGDQQGIVDLAVQLGEATQTASISLEQCLVIADAVTVLGNAITDPDQSAAILGVAGDLCTGDNFQTAALGAAPSPN